MFPVVRYSGSSSCERRRPVDPTLAVALLEADVCRREAGATPSLKVGVEHGIRHWDAGQRRTQGSGARRGDSRCKYSAVNIIIRRGNRRRGNATRRGGRRAARVAVERALGSVT